jgi:hypothetical protein
VTSAGPSGRRPASIQRIDGHGPDGARPTATWDGFADGEADGADVGAAVGTAEAPEPGLELGEAEAMSGPDEAGGADEHALRTRATRIGTRVRRMVLGSSRACSACGTPVSDESIPWHVTQGVCRHADRSHPSQPSHDGDADRLRAVVVSGRRAAASWGVLMLVGLTAIAIAALVARDALFGRGPTAVHDPARVASRIHVCGRDYNGGRVLRRGEWPADAPFVLVEPAPFAPCAPAVEDPAGVCRGSSLQCATWTVVFVRVGEDAYAEYELLGGP